MRKNELGLWYIFKAECKSAKSHRGDFEWKVRLLSVWAENVFHDVTLWCLDCTV